MQMSPRGRKRALCSSSVLNKVQAVGAVNMWSVFSQTVTTRRHQRETTHRVTASLGLSVCVCGITRPRGGTRGSRAASAPTDDAAGLHPVLVDLHQVVGQVAELRLHALRRNRGRALPLCRWSPRTWRDTQQEQTAPVPGPV